MGFEQATMKSEISTNYERYPHNFFETQSLSLCQANQLWKAQGRSRGTESLGMHPPSRLRPLSVYCMQVRKFAVLSLILRGPQAVTPRGTARRVETVKTPEQI
jgi:hypothetical protein